MSFDPDHTQTFQASVNAVSQTHPEIFAKIRATVEGENPILTGAFTGYVDDQPCGCLLTDNVANDAPDIWHAMFKHQTCYGGLALFYGISDDQALLFQDGAYFLPQVLIDLYHEFDAWNLNGKGTRTNYTEGGLGYVSADGRCELRTIFNNAAKEATAS